jgi:hypothetical protein
LASPSVSAGSIAKSFETLKFESPVGDFAGDGSPCSRGRSRKPVWLTSHDATAIIATMRTNVFIEQREQLASVVTTLPRELLETNAAPLLGIVSELQASSVIEIGVVQAVTRVNVEDPQAIKTQREILEDYQDRRLYVRDGTHCSNIDRIATQLRRDAASSAATAELDQVLTPLRSADVEIVDDIEAILEASVDAIVKIDACTRVDDATAEQRQFAERMRPTIDRIRNNLRKLNELSGKLIDLMW